MAFQFSEKHIVERYTLGYTVFRQIIPPSLLSDLRKACEKVHEIARATAGPRAMRLTGVTRNNLPEKPFRDYAELPELNDAIARVLSAGHRHGQLDAMAILIETADIPVTQSWHRDARDHEVPPENREEFNRVALLPAFINQVNCPLYEDAALWYVPGSHIRADTSAETAAIRSTILVGDHFTNEEREQLGVQYCRNMPGSVCLAMDAGDFALYHPLALHLGSVLTYRKRATLHDAVFSPESRAYHNKWVGWKQEKVRRDREAAAATSAKA